MAKMQENTDRDLGKSSEEIINECMVLSALQSTELALESRPAQGPDHHLLQGLAPARSDRRLPRPRREDRPAAPPRADRGGNGDEGSRLVVRGDGRPPERRDRRHDPRLAHAAARRRPARGGLRRVRAAAVARHPGLRAERHRLPRLRPDDVDDVPGAGRADPGLRPGADAGLEERARGGRER